MVAFNKIKALRKKLNMTQAELAKKAKTSQQQVQRIESGAQLTRLDLAKRIAEALGTKLELAFPQIVPPLKKLQRSKDPSPDNDDLRKSFADSGIDLDPRVWSVHLRFRNGLEREYVVDSTTQSRLWSHLQRNEGQYVSFDTPQLGVAVNTKQLARWQFLFDPPSENIDAVEDCSASYEDTAGFPMAIWFNDSQTPEIHQVEPDEDEMDGDTDTGADFQGLLFDLAHMIDDDDLQHFEDTDGESVFFVGGAVTLVEIPAIVVRPSLYEEYLQCDPQDEAPTAGATSRERKDVH